MTQNLVSETNIHDRGKLRALSELSHYVFPLSAAVFSIQSYSLWLVPKKPLKLKQKEKKKVVKRKLDCEPARRFDPTTDCLVNMAGKKQDTDRDSTGDLIDLTVSAHWVRLTLL